MRYMFLIYNKEADRDAASAAEMDRCLKCHLALIEETGRRGILQGTAPLHPTSTARSVRHQGGKVLVIDGPFAETKEQLGGYYILDCRDLNDALEWAARVPTVGGTGCVEIRPLMELPAR